MYVHILTTMEMPYNLENNSSNLAKDKGWDTNHVE